MGVAWGAADAALSRAGAGSVAEAWCNRVPTLFMPYPYHKDQHQRLNVARLVEAGAGIVCEDQVDRDSNINRNGAALLALVTDVEKRAAMREALIKLGPADGASRVAETLLASA
jgi:UDP-N-acetylglucosamine--N-acetylmuramyl-(pentapeptide) pyrophosphoryl-undecaprenol N-acetylglucosamine transferase